MKLMEGVSRYCGPVICRDVQNRFLTATRKDIKFDVILTLYLSICPGTDISAMVQPIGVKFCMIVELWPGRVFSYFGGDNFRGLQMPDQKGECVSFWVSKSHLTFRGIRRNSKYVALLWRLLRLPFEVWSSLTFKRFKIEAYCLRGKFCSAEFSKNVWHGAVALKGLMPMKMQVFKCQIYCILGLFLCIPIFPLPYLSSLPSSLSLSSLISPRSPLSRERERQTLKLSYRRQYALIKSSR